MCVCRAEMKPAVLLASEARCTNDPRAATPEQAGHSLLHACLVGVVDARLARTAVLALPCRCAGQLVVARCRLAARLVNLGGRHLREEPGRAAAAAIEQGGCVLLATLEQGSWVARLQPGFGLLHHSNPRPIP